MSTSTRSREAALVQAIRQFDAARDTADAMDPDDADKQPAMLQARSAAVKLADLLRGSSRPVVFQDRLYQANGRGFVSRTEVQQLY